MTEWFETFFAGLYAEVQARQFSEAVTLRQAKLIKRLMKLRKGMRVLDVPCGMGRLTLPLARKGLVMTGVDFMERYLRPARCRAKREKLDIRFMRRDMRKIPFENEFDGVLNWFTSFGYFSDEENLAFLKKAFTALKPGGRMLIDTLNRSSFISHFHAESKRQIGKVKVASRDKYDARTERDEDVWTISNGGRTERHRLSIRLYNGTEMRAILRKAGFRDIRLYGHPPVGKFTRHSQRMIAVARRPKG